MLPGNKEQREIPQKSGHKVPVHETMPSVDRVRVYCCIRSVK
jgi:hypothetical protein